MAAYANRIGVAHVFETRPQPWHQVGPGSKFYDKFLPLWNGTLDRCDRLMFADTDLLPVAGLTENIFDSFNADVALCTEPMQPDMRAKAKSGICAEQDERWAAMVLEEWGGIMPRREDGKLKVYNAGLSLWTRAALQRARREFISPKEYVRACDAHGLYPFYGHDQNHLHAMLFMLGFKVQDLDNEWNRYVHFRTEGRKIVGLVDPRTPATRMVHVQLRGADEWDEAKLHRVVNLPQSEWKL